MKSTLFLILACSILAVCFAAVARGVFKDPNYPGKCAIKENLILEPGTHQNPDECGRIICHEDSSAEFHTCGVIMPPPGYVLGEPKNPKADYPDCCQRNFVKKD